MKGLTHKIAAGSLSAASTLVLLASPALATVNVEISGNGAASYNHVNARHSSHTSVRQSNHADITNSVSVNSNTGGNRANKNTGGDVSVSTGDSNVSVRVSNRANSHSIFWGSGSSGNGNHSNNDNHNGSVSHLRTVLTGKQEVPGPGDKNGWGVARVSVNTQTDRVCARIWVTNIKPATAAHIHVGAKGVAGPVVISLATPNVHGFSYSCHDVSDSLAAAIKDNPHNYYVNIHNSKFPDGAVRGQL